MDFNCGRFAIVLIIKVSIISRRAISPNSSIILSMGFTPKFPEINWYTQSRLGNKAIINTIGLIRLKFLVENID